MVVMNPSLVYILSAKKKTRASYLTRVNGVSCLSLDINKTLI